MSALTLAAAGSAMALGPRTLATALLPRVVGLYIAGCAGGIQLLDIMVDRLGLDDRVFTFAIVLAVIGIPFAGAGALLFDTARAERRTPRTETDQASATAAGQAARSAVAGTDRGDTTTRIDRAAADRTASDDGSARIHRDGSARIHRDDAARIHRDDTSDRVGDARVTDVYAQLPRRLELALSYHRIAVLQSDAGDAAEAAAHRTRAVAEMERLMEDLERLLDEARG
jgi:hypothetical protein